MYILNICNIKRYVMLEDTPKAVGNAVFGVRRSSRTTMTAVVFAAPFLLITAWMTYSGSLQMSHSYSPGSMVSVSLFS